MLDRLWEILQATFKALLPFVVLQPYERGVLCRLGVFKRALGPGFHWVIPLHVDQVFDEHVTPRTERIQSLATTTLDGKAVGFDAVVTYQINDITKALLAVTDLKDAIADSCAGVIGTELADKSWDDIAHGRVLDDLEKACRKRGWRWGVEIMSVQLAGISLVKNLRVTVSGVQHHGTTFHINPVE